MRRRVYIVPCPGVGLPAVDMGQAFRWFRGIREYLYRDLDDKCKRIILMWPSRELVIKRPK